MCNSKPTNRLELAILAIAILILSVLAITYVSTRETFNIYHKIAIGEGSFAMLGAILLLLGAILENRFLVWTWLVIIVPVVVSTTTVFIIKLCEEWEFIKERQRVYTIAALIVFPCFGLYMVYMSVIYALELKRSRNAMEDRIGIYLVRCL